MGSLSALEPRSVFKVFEEICTIPHGSGDMQKISNYCVNFAQKNGLKYVQDEYFNVVIYKPASKDFEGAEPIILQGHLDMVCQKEKGVEKDFEKEGIEPLFENGFITANGTTLGADNGIAVAMIMSILADKNLEHPPIEAVFTTDEEIGMLGADKLDFSLLSAKRMINIDSEEGDTVTVSCAGGSEFKMEIPCTKKAITATALTITVAGLKGGHSGVEIDKGRQNSNTLMGRILNALSTKFSFNIIEINGGEKANAIPTDCVAKICLEGIENAKFFLEEYAKEVKKELIFREENCSITIEEDKKDNYCCFDSETTKKVIFALINTPCGIVEMSKEIEGLVETSLNLGILFTTDKSVTLIYALRSNKTSAMDFLESRLLNVCDMLGAGGEISGRYLPWEYNSNSNVRNLYVAAYEKKYGKMPQIAAIHAGLECSVFAAKIKGLDCIAVGPDMTDVHTPKESLSVGSAMDIYEILLDVLASAK